MSDSNPYYFVDTAISAAQTHEIVQIGVFAALLAAQVASAGAVVGRMRAAGPHANGGAGGVWHSCSVGGFGDYRSGAMRAGRGRNRVRPRSLISGMRASFAAPRLGLQTKRTPPVMQMGFV